MRTTIRRMGVLVCALVMLAATASPSMAVPIAREDSYGGLAHLARPARPTAAGIRAQAVTAPDSYENDDTFAGATTLTPDVLSADHNFFNSAPPAESHGAYDIDYMKFTAVASHTYVVQTQFQGMPEGEWWSAPMELVLDDGSWGGYGKILVYSEYENGMDSSNSKLSWTCPVSGTYYIRVGDWFQEYPNTVYSVRLEDVGKVTPGTVSRVGGADRYEVAATLARNDAATFQGVKSFVIASGLDRAMADALSASGLAGALKAPVLLVRADRAYLPAPTLAAIRAAVADNPGATIQFHIVGGPASVPVALEKQLRAAAANRATIQRISGIDRYAVAANVAADIRKHVPEYLLTAFVTNGQNPTYFTDALTAAPVANRLAAPILLVKSTAIPPATAAALKLYPNRIVIGTPDKAIYQSVGKAILGSDFSKGAWITGGTRAGIARRFAEFWEWQQWPELPYTAHYTMTNKLSDALTAGSSPRLSGNYILYVDTTVNVDRMIPYPSDQFLNGRRTMSPALTIVGGPGSVDATVERRLHYLMGDCFSTPPQELGGTLLGGGFESGLNGATLGSPWVPILNGGAVTYSGAHAAVGTGMAARIAGSTNATNEFGESASAGTTGTIEYRFWIYCDSTNAYRYVYDPAGPNGSFFIEWVPDGKVYVYLDRAGQPAPYNTADYHQIGWYTPGAMQYRVVCDYTKHTFTVAGRASLSDDWVSFRKVGAPDNDIPMRSGSVSQANGISFQMFGPGNFWVDEIRYSKTGITDEPGIGTNYW